MGRHPAQEDILRKNLKKFSFSIFRKVKLHIVESRIIVYLIKR
jgi:hypothetical protein